MGTPLYVGKALPDGEVGHLLGCGNPILDISAMVDKDKAAATTEPRD